MTTSRRAALNRWLELADDLLRVGTEEPVPFDPLEEAATFWDDQVTFPSGAMA